MCDLSLKAVEAALTTRRLGRPTLYFPRIGSTNDVAHARALEGAPEGLLVLADEQTAGRGRLDRAWWAPPGASLLFSLLLRPSLPLRLAGQLPMGLGLAAVEGIEAVTGLRPALKWPNDVVHGGRKLGGLLAELRSSGEQLDYAVLGLGLNVNLSFDRPSAGGNDMLPASRRAVERQRPPIAAPAGLADSAVSLSMIWGRAVDRVALLAAILERYEARYERLLGGETLHDAWAARLDTLGQDVIVTLPAGQLRGVAARVTSAGALVVRRADGREDVVWGGDVTTVR